MITTPLSRLAEILNIDISSMNRADAQDAVCEAAAGKIHQLTTAANHERIRKEAAFYQADYFQKIATRATREIFKTFGNDECWIFQDDGNDYPESLSCPVVMAPEKLRELLAFRDGRLDAERLDYLDSLNKEFNERNGSNYGWEIDWNHNRIALHDIGPMGMSVRQAIDEHRERFMSNQETKETEHD